MNYFIELFTNLICSINLLTCVEATHPTNVFNAKLIEYEEKTYIVKLKRDKYDSSLLRKLLRLNNSTLYFQDINNIDNFFKIKVPYSASVRDILYFSDKKLLAIGSLYPRIYEIDISSKSIKKLPFKFDEFEYMNGVKVLNDIYVTGFRINPKNGMPFSNGNIYKLNSCNSYSKYCVKKIKTKPANNNYRFLSLICRKDNKCIPAIKDFYDLKISIKNLKDEKLSISSCENLTYNKNQFRRTFIPEKCSEEVNLEQLNIFKNLSQNNFNLKVGKKEDGAHFIGEIYPTKNGEKWRILDIAQNNIILKKISSNKIFLLNQNGIFPLNIKLNKRLVNLDENKSDINHISGLRNKLYVSNMLVNNQIYSYDFKDKRGNWIKLEPLKNQENGQPQLIVPLTSNYIIVVNYPYSRSGFYKLEESRGILVKEWALNTSERFDRPSDFLECKDKNILVVQKDKDNGLNNKKYFFELPKKLNRESLKFVDKISIIDKKEIKDCYSFFNIKNDSQDNFDLNKVYPLPITKGFTNMPITIKDSSDKNFCIPFNNKVVCTKNNLFKRIMFFMINFS